MAEQQDERTAQEAPFAGNGHMDLRDIVAMLLDYDDDTFIEQLVWVITSTDHRWNTQQGPRVLRRPGILQRVARIMQEDPELYEGVFLPGIRLDRRFNIARLEGQMHELLAREPQTFPTPQSAEALIHTQHAPLRYFVTDILVEGLTLLAGKPKKGKSYLALDMALAIACGREAFRKFRTEKARVLFVSLEDGERRLQRRLLTIQPNLQRVDNLSFLYTFPRLGAGALEALTHYSAAYQVIIIDTLGRILPEESPRRQSLSEYQMITDVLGAIQKLAEDKHMAIMPIDHLRKASSEDDTDGIIGSQGKAGAADNLLFYTRKGEETDGVLKVLGRDLETEKFVMSLIAGHLECMGRGEVYEVDGEQNKIINILREEGKPMQVSDIMKALGIVGDQQYARLRKALFRLYTDDRIGRTKRGQFRLYSDDRLTDDERIEGVPF